MFQCIFFSSVYYEQTQPLFYLLLQFQLSVVINGLCVIPQLFINKWLMFFYYCNLTAVVLQWWNEMKVYNFIDFCIASEQHDHMDRLSEEFNHFSFIFFPIFVPANWRIYNIEEHLQTSTSKQSAFSQLLHSFFSFDNLPPLYYLSKRNTVLVTWQLQFLVSFRIRNIWCLQNKVYSQR